ncbi:sensor histidine kinase [Glycomyces arizonensis]|uniref:sensor histidine kinase n=1 Tax=Glycomyces arizonensis TaxID=256035 RepID=UPI0012EB65E4|nr:ATP-binding protein [Glycomyces arizonensis]
MSAKPGWSARLTAMGARTLKSGIIAGLLLVLAGESLSSGIDTGMAIATLVGPVQAAVSLFVIGVYVCYRPGRKRWIAVAAFASLAATLAHLLTTSERGIGVAEGFALLLLMLFAVRHWDAPPGRWVAFVLGAAILAIGLRFYVYPGSVFGGMVMTGMGLSTVVGFGAYLRGLDKLRRETQEEVRRAERLELAREMHDFVAHHVTGIVVLAQAAQVTDTAPGASPRPRPEPEGASLPPYAAKAFADIEEAGLAALASMRRMVKMLRDEDGGTGVNPLGDLSQIEDLVERFSREGTDATCFISPELAGKVAPEIAATAHRIVRESLTNVRKHAQGARQVRVVVAAAGSGGLEVSVRDDGRAARGRLAQSGGGMGLLGLGERVEAVGGQLRAEPRPGGGWQVVAWLPHTGQEAHTPVAPTDSDRPTGG